MVPHNSQVIAATELAKARTVFTHSNARVVGSNLTRGMDVCACLFCLRVVLCVGSA
jgi:hypothetical protein